MKFLVSLTDEARKQQYIKTGERASYSETVVVDDSELSPEIRANIVEAFEALQAIGINKFSTIDRKINVGKLKVVTRGGRSAEIGVSGYDAVPSAKQVMADFLQMPNDIPAMQAELEKVQAELDAKREAEREAMRSRNEEQNRKLAEREAKREAAARRLRAAREAASIPQWSADGKAIIDLRDALFFVAGDEPDKRYRNWAKIVSGVTKKHDNGYDFEGDFVREGTVEISREYTVYLVASTNGSRKYHTTTYRVVVLNPETGKLERTDITTDSARGWALRIRDQVKALLG
jgi:hypothetical protein